MTIMKQASAQDKGLEWQELEAFIRTAAQTGLAAHEVEQGLWKRLLALGHHLLGQFFAMLGDGDQGETVRVGEGRVLRRLAEPHRRVYQSIFGHFELDRVVYGSREGQRIEYVPLDTRLQLPAGRFSYLLQDWDQALAVETPYQQVNQVLGRILGLEQSVASLEQMSRSMAQAVEGFWEAQPPAPPAEVEQIVVLSGDGKGIPMRKPATAPAIDAHRHQRGPKPERKKMAVVGAVYQIEPYRRTPEEVLEALFRDPSAPPDERPTSCRPAPQHKRLRAQLSDAQSEPFKAASTVIMDWLAEEAHERDCQHQHPWVVLMDGQEVLWETAAQALDETPRIEVLDLLHATGYLWEAVHLFHPSGSEAAFKMMKFLVLALLSGMGETLVSWLEIVAEPADLSTTQQARLAKICQYLRHNLPRMRYDQYLAAGYPIASGVIEGACRHVVKDRMERAGMHWTIPGAQAMLQLRCVALNGQWDELMRYRIEQETARLYPYAELVEQAQWPLPEAA